MFSQRSEALRSKGLEALKRKSSKEKDKLIKLLSDQLRHDLTRLLGEGIESDFTVDLNKQCFQLHRCILKSRCPSLYEALQVFLTSNTREVTPPTTLINYMTTVVRYIYCEEDVEYVSHLVEQLIHFFTTGKLQDKAGDLVLSAPSATAFQSASATYRKPGEFMNDAIQQEHTDLHVDDNVKECLESIVDFSPDIIEGARPGIHDGEDGKIDQNENKIGKIEGKTHKNVTQVISPSSGSGLNGGIEGTDRADFTKCDERPETGGFHEACVKPDDPGSDHGMDIVKPDDAGSDHGMGFVKLDDAGNDHSIGLVKPDDAGSDHGMGLVKPDDAGSDLGMSLVKPDDAGSDHGMGLVKPDDAGCDLHYIGLETSGAEGVNMAVLHYSHQNNAEVDLVNVDSLKLYDARNGEEEVGNVTPHSVGTEVSNIDSVKVDTAGNKVPNIPENDMPSNDNYHKTPAEINRFDIVGQNLAGPETDDICMDEEKLNDAEVGLNMLKVVHVDSSVSHIDGKAVDDPGVVNRMKISQVICENDTKCERTGDSEPACFTEAVSVLGSNLLYIYQQGVDVDVVLLAEGHRFYAHRCILCARSEYFRAMLSGGWAESSSNEVTMEGLSSENLERLLLCIYGGFLETFDLTLMAMADMCDLSSLKSCMEYTLLNDKCHFFHKPCSICLTGVAETLPISATYGLIDLQTSALQWSNKYFSRLWPTRTFAQLPQEVLTQCQKALIEEIGILNVISHALELEKVITALRNLKWAEPVGVMATKVMDSCVSYLGRHLKSYVVNRSPGLIDKEYRGMQADNIKDLVEKSTEFLYAKDALKLYKYLSERCKELQATAIETQLEYHGHFLNDVLHFVKQYLVKNISQIISIDEWSVLSSQQQEELKKG